MNRSRGRVAHHIVTVSTALTRSAWRMPTAEELFRSMLPRPPPPAAAPPDGASWWSVARQRDRAAQAREAAWSTTFDRATACAKSCGLPSASFESAYTAQQEMLAAVEAAVPWVDEPEPPDGGGVTVGIAKGCASVTAPVGAIARRGGGQFSGVVFYGRDGAVLAAYTTDAARGEVWAIACSEQKARVARRPIVPVRKSDHEAMIQAVFGGA